LLRKKVVFVLGSGHCGSTLLDLILGSHSMAFSLGEIRRIATAVDGAHEGPLKICGVCADTCDFWNGQVSEAWLKRFYSGKNPMRSVVRRATNYLLNHYDYLMRCSGKSIMIDSSKSTAWFDLQLKPAFKWRDIDPHLLYLRRDGRAVVSAYYRKYPKHGLERIAQDWARQTRQMETYYSRYPAHQKIEVNYEELATQPEPVVESICDHLGIEYEPNMLRYWAHDHHHVFGNGGTRNLIYRYREQFEPLSEQTKARVSSAKQHYKHEYYDEVDIAIRLDERWRRELDEQALATFERVAGEANRTYAYGDSAA
jgi:hypothetical protein